MTNTPRNANDAFAIKNFIMLNYKRNSFELNLNEPFFFDGSIFIICLKGSGVIRINYKNYELRTNSVLTVFPKQIVETIQKTDDYLIEILFISSSFIAELPFHNYSILYKITKNPCVQVAKKDMFDLLELHALVVKYNYETDNYFRKQMITGLLYTLVMKISTLYTKEFQADKERKISRQEELTEKFFVLLLNNETNERQVSYYAEKLFLTPKYLSGMIKKETGYPIQNWINEVILLHAKNLLKTTPDSILEISEKLNFPTPSSFIHFFKLHLGMTPLKYRTEI